MVEQLQNTIKTTIEKRIDPMIKETQEHQQEARFNLDRSKEKFISDNELKQRETKLIEDIERRFKECEERFRGSVGKNIEQLEERVQDSLAIIKRINNPSLNPNSDFNTDSGIDTIGLFSSIGGLVLLLLTPVVG
ncbi:hypothetical protein HMPREF1397_00439 [Helicobacter pylori GAM115Ai]|nr:hypothetical protein HMPREF1397_00439 [Helicobacter pylori GAM115Ai]